MSDLAELGTLVRKQNDSWLGERAPQAERERFLLAFRQRRHRHSRSKKPWLLAAGVLSAAAALVLFVASRQSSDISALLADQGRAVVVGDEVNAMSSPSALKFSDGSEIVLDRGTQLRLGALGKRGASVGLLHGRLSAKVKHRAETDWRLQAGPYQVRVTGTRFDLAWDEKKRQFELNLSEGEVRVSGGNLGSERVVHAGQRLVLPEQQHETHATQKREPDSGASPHLPAQPGEEQAPAPAKRRESSPSTPEAGEPTSWLDHARAGEYTAAYQEAAREGFQGLTESTSAGELIVLADVARFSGHGGQAQDALTTLRRRFAGSNEAATAAFQLGRLSGGSPTAVRWFRTYLRERPAGSLAREASGRLMELLSRLGNENAARVQARDYLKRYPAGPHAAFARQLTRR